MSMAKIESEDSSKKEAKVDEQLSSSRSLLARMCISSGNIAIIIRSPEI